MKKNREIRITKDLIDLLKRVGQVNSLGVEHGLIYYKNYMLESDLKKIGGKSVIAGLISEKYDISEPDSSNMSRAERGNKLSEYLKKANVCFTDSKRSSCSCLILGMLSLSLENRKFIGEEILNNRGNINYSFLYRSYVKTYTENPNPKMNKKYLANLKLLIHYVIC
jgi:hypothetical protein